MNNPTERRLTARNIVQHYGDKTRAAANLAIDTATDDQVEAICTAYDGAAGDPDKAKAAVMAALASKATADATAAATAAADAQKAADEKAGEPVKAKREKH